MANKELTGGQQVGLSMLSLVSGSLSIAGSSTIIYKVLSNRLYTTSYNRIMLSLSICDVIASSGWVLSPFLVPSETSSQPWAIGNDATCTFLGIVTQLGFSAVFYNCFLSFYFLLTIRYGVNRQVFAQKVEPWIHGFCILFSILTASVGASIGLFSEFGIGLGCWVNNYPIGCVGDECISDEIAYLYGAGPAMLTFVSLFINNILIYAHVRRVFSESKVEQSERKKRQNTQKREVATQGFLYVASFSFCYIPVGIVRAIESFTTVEEEKAIEHDIFWLLVIQSFTLPLQGILNVVVYNRPNYFRVRAAYPNISQFEAILIACFDPDIPKLDEIMDSSTNDASPQPNVNKCLNQSSSDAGFMSTLQQIEEGSDINEYNIGEHDKFDESTISGCHKSSPGIECDLQGQKLSIANMAFVQYTANLDSTNPLNARHDQIGQGDKETGKMIAIQSEAISKLTEDSLFDEEKLRAKRIHTDDSFDNQIERKSS